MTNEQFFEQMMSDDLPKASRLRRWWEWQMLKLWLKLPMNATSKRTNEDFIRSIPPSATV